MSRILALCALLMVGCVDPSITGGDLPMDPEPQPDVGLPDAQGEPDAPSPQPDVVDDTGDPDPVPEPDPEPTPNPEPDPEPTPEPTPVRYRHDELLSPITATVAQSMRDIRARADGPDDLVFMKVGASGTVSRNLLYCFAGNEGSTYTIDLDGRIELEDSIEFFRMGDAAGTTPFDRETEAARVGQSARWAISGDPSPMAAEIAAINPRFAIVNYGTNDMGLGTTHLSALFPFYDNFTALIDALLDQGIVPIITGLNPRSDREVAATWVPTYNTVVRGVAEAHQVPFVNQYLAAAPLPNQGLVSDGIHGNVFRDDRGRSQPCVFTQEAMAFNYNVRNLLTMEALHQSRLVALEEAPAPHERRDPQLGNGSLADPFIVDRLPFTHSGDTTASPNSAIDAYPACDTGQNESGPEYVYQFQLDAPTDVRMIVLDSGDVDIDIHLIEGDGEPERCIDRDNKSIERTLAAGTWTVVLDTFVGSGGARSGPFLFVIVEP